jgi:hypothetical protein
VIYAVTEHGGRLRVAAFPADRSPLPFGEAAIARVAGADLRMMRLWARRRAGLVRREDEGGLPVR